MKHTQRILIATWLLTLGTLAGCDPDVNKDWWKAPDLDSPSATENTASPESATTETKPAFKPGFQPPTGKTLAGNPETTTGTKPPVEKRVEKRVEKSDAPSMKNEAPQTVAELKTLLKELRAANNKLALVVATETQRRMQADDSVAPLKAQLAAAQRKLDAATDKTASATAIQARLDAALSQNRELKQDVLQARRNTQTAQAALKKLRSTPAKTPTPTANASQIKTLQASLTTAKRDASMYRRTLGKARKDIELLRIEAENANIRRREVEAQLAKASPVSPVSPVAKVPASAAKAETVEEMTSRALRDAVEARKKFENAQATLLEAKRRLEKSTPSTTPPAPLPVAPRPAPIAPVAAPTPTQTNGVRTSIRSIQGTTIHINAGSNQGVKRGMKLIVFRDDKFVGYLQIVQVDANQAAGSLTRKIRPPAKGDTVVDRLE